MDAQAQDRAHRIGQTREVHIYRLVCRSTVEENILTKARQKRHLDFLVMSEGDFDVGSLFSAGNLMDLLGNGDSSSSVTSKLTKSRGTMEQRREMEMNVDVIDVEAAMAAVEDEEDVTAMKGAKAEAAEEAAEFDESSNVPQLPEDADEKESSALVSQKSVNKEDDMEEEFASWQASVGAKDFGALEAALKPVERYALNFRTVIDPYYSLHYLSEQQRLDEMQADEASQGWDIETIEKEKEEEEYRALADGELLAVNLTRRELSRVKSLYLQEKSKRRKARKLRQLTGEGWVHYIDDLTGTPFWYNEDTGEASYGQPDIIKQREVLKAAMERKYNAFPLPLILKVLSYLDPYPDRVRCSYVCARWKRAAFDESFYKTVLSIESGARDISTVGGSSSQADLGENTFTSISDALAAAKPGDTISLGNGHHWEPCLLFDKPVRIIGSEDDPSRVCVEVADGVEVVPKAGKVALIGITLMRSRRNAMPKSLFTAKGVTVSMISCVLNNDNAPGSCLYLESGAELNMHSCTVQGGKRAGITLLNSLVTAFYTKIHLNDGAAISCVGSAVVLEDSRVIHNSTAARCSFNSACSMSYCDIKDNSSKPVAADFSSTFYSGNCSGDVNALAEFNSRVVEVLGDGSGVPHGESLPSEKECVNDRTDRKKREHGFLGDSPEDCVLKKARTDHTIDDSVSCYSEE